MIACPNCGSKEIDIVKKPYYWDGSEAEYLECGDCGWTSTPQEEDD